MNRSWLETLLQARKGNDLSATSGYCREIRDPLALTRRTEIESRAIIVLFRPARLSSFCS